MNLDMMFAPSPRSLVKPADTNVGLVVVLDKAWYTAGCTRHLPDASIYRVVPVAEAAALVGFLRLQLGTCSFVRHTTQRPRPLLGRRKNSQ